MAFAVALAAFAVAPAAFAVAPAAFAVAPSVLGRLGADVTVLNARPDGTNINAHCGSTHPEGLQHRVVAEDAQVGLAFDGDADRVLAVDHQGRLVDGDQLVALCALDRRDRGLLVGDTVVVTVMTNLGFRLAMAERGIKCVETQVGDRYVLEALEEGAWSLGGEQSGHVIFRDLATTGDGLLTGVQVLDVVARSGRPLAELAAVMTRLPQVLRNVRVADRDGLDVIRSIRARSKTLVAAPIKSATSGGTRDGRGAYPGGRGGGDRPPRRRGRAFPGPERPLERGAQGPSGPSSGVHRARVGSRSLERCAGSWPSSVAPAGEPSPTCAR